MKLYFSFIFVLLQTIAASAVEYEGRMRCKIIYQQVVQLIDGRPQIYSGYKDSYEVGDILNFEFSYVDYSNGEFIFGAELRDRARDKSLVYTSFLSNYTGTNYSVKKGQLNLWSTSEWEDSPPYTRMLYMDTESVVIDDIGQMTLKRYYKGDFQGIVHLNDSNTSHLVMIDCRTELDALDKIINRLFSAQD